MHLCTYVSEERGDGEGVGSKTLSLLSVFIITDKTVEGVGVMKDEDLKLEEIETSHTQVKTQEVLSVLTTGGVRTRMTRIFTYTHPVG